MTATASESGLAAASLTGHDSKHNDLSNVSVTRGSQDPAQINIEIQQILNAKRASGSSSDGDEVGMDVQSLVGGKPAPATRSSSNSNSYSFNASSGSFSAAGIVGRPNRFRGSGHASSTHSQRQSGGKKHGKHQPKRLTKQNSDASVGSHASAESESKSVSSTASEQSMAAVVQMVVSGTTKRSSGSSLIWTRRALFVTMATVLGLLIASYVSTSLQVPYRYAS